MSLFFQHGQCGLPYTDAPHSRAAAGKSRRISDVRAREKQRLSPLLFGFLMNWKEGWELFSLCRFRAFAAFKGRDLLPARRRN